MGWLIAKALITAVMLSMPFENTPTEEIAAHSSGVLSLVLKRFGIPV